MKHEKLCLAKGLPANREAEQFVLGSILLDERTWREAEALTTADFTTEQHRVILTAIRRVAERQRPIEPLTVIDELENANELAKAGGFAYVASLVELMPRVQSIQAYVAIVREKTVLRKAIYAAQEVIELAIQEDPLDDVLGIAHKRFSELEAGSLEKEVEPVKASMDRIGGKVVFPERRALGTSSPFPALDRMTCGFHGGELIVLAARPRMGKTAFALRIVEHLAVHPHPDYRVPVAFFSIEMSKLLLLRRMICSHAGVDLMKVMRRQLDAADNLKLSRSMGAISSSSLFLSDDEKLTVHDIASCCRKLQRERGQLGLIVVDYLQLLEGTTQRKNETRNEVVAMQSRSMKRLARELDTTVLLLSQLSRKCEERPNKRPMLSDLRDSGEIEAAADTVLALYRHRVYVQNGDRVKKEDTDQPEAECLIIKQRNGPEGTVPLKFHESITRFEDPAAATEEDLQEDLEFEPQTVGK